MEWGTYAGAFAVPETAFAAAEPNPPNIHALRQMQQAVERHMDQTAIAMIQNPETQPSRTVMALRWLAWNCVELYGVRMWRVQWLCGLDAYQMPKANPTDVFMPADAYDELVEHFDWNGEYIPDQWDAWIDAVGREVRGG